MTETYINLGCGAAFVDNPKWINLDFFPLASSVRRANLLGPLPLASDEAQLVYASHFLEHIPKPDVPAFLQECYRVLKPGGVLRLVLPDLQEMARSYLKYREVGDHVRADFLVLEIIDQCVRQTPGGELGVFYRCLQAEQKSDQTEMIAFIRERTGTNLQANQGLPRKCSMGLLGREKFVRLCNRLQRLWLRTCILGLPAAFRTQNVSLASIGERHHWLWDFHQLQQVLETVGFISVARHNAETSTISDFPFYPLDIDHEGLPRKGVNSMYVEARKPG